MCCRLLTFVLLFQSFQWMSRVLQAVDDCVIISEFPVDESCAAGH